MSSRSHAVPSLCSTSRFFGGLVLSTGLLASTGSACRPAAEGQVSPDEARELRAGMAAPEVSREDHLGRLQAVPGQQATLVYFYPRDATPGCTKEACAIRDVWQRFEAAGIRVLGVSSDDNESHRAFAEDHKLPFGLIADVDGRWAAAFGVGGLGRMYARTSFLLAADGRVLAVYEKVDPGVHAEEVLADFARLSGAATPG